MKWLEENWLQLHLALAPLGTLVVTWLLWLSAGDGWQWWNNRADMEQMGQIVPWGAVVYGSIIFVIERLGRMFWALAQREKDIEKGRQQGREEVIKKLREKNVDIPPEILKELEDLDHGSPSTLGKRLARFAHLDDSGS